MVLRRTRPLGLPAPLTKHIGPNSKEKPRMNNNNPGPSGSRGPMLRSRSTLQTATADPPSEYACDFPGCKRTFGTATGKGLHCRRAHPDWFDEKQTTTAVKARWNDEETRLLAIKEVELTKQGVKFINQALEDVFPDRTLESIKGKRKQPAYKQIVKDLLEAPSEIEATEEQESDTETPSYKTAIADYVTSLPRPSGKEFDLPRLLRICDSLATKNQAEISLSLTLYLREIFPRSARNNKKKPVGDAESASRRQKRRAEYARTQDLWRKNRSKCLRIILDEMTGVQTPPKDIMVPFWEAVFNGGGNTSPGNCKSQPVIADLWAPVTLDEIKKSMPANTTSAGPDGVSARLLKRMPSNILCRILNLFMWCGKAPTHLLESITTLIPKKAGANKPADFRPITISSVLVRAFHRILASRMSRLIKLDQRQRAFRPTDGCSDNVFLLDLILRHHHKQHKPLFIASLDIAKAFDSVSHVTIEETLVAMGLPAPMTAYIMDVYKNSTTSLCCNSWSSDRIIPTCGVKQGDPMSPVIFNMVIDRLLKQLPEEVGVRIGGLVVNAAAFADDLLLFATTPLGLQKLLDQSTRFLSKCGLQVNASKCMTVALRNVPHEKKTVVDKETVFLCQGRVLPALKRTDEWTYLGVPFTPEGKCKINTTTQIQEAVQKLTRAPLKPQQRLFALRTMVIPGLYHKLELGSTTLSMLRKCDRLLRHAVRSWLSLPTDTPNAYFHASVKDGGLGIASLRWSVPLRRLNRLQKLPLAQNQAEGAVGSFLKQELKQCQVRLLDGVNSIRSFVDINARWATQLYSKVDGCGLKESSKVPQQHIWIQDGTRFLTGRDYLQSCKLRINALPTRSRTTRGRPQDRLCRAGCNRPETLNHVLQQCHRTHGPRIKRHDAVASVISRALETRGYAVHIEPKFMAAEGVRKPDIVAVLGVTALTIDVQVVNDQISLDNAHGKKVEYYVGIEDLVKDKYNVQEVRTTSATLSWRGIWSQQSADGLVELGVLRRKTLKVISSRVLVGGLAAFHQFNKTTAVVEGGGHQGGRGS